MCNSQGPILLMLSVLQSINTDANDATSIKYKLNVDFKRFFNFNKSLTYLNLTFNYSNFTTMI